MTASLKETSSKYKLRAKENLYVALFHVLERHSGKVVLAVSSHKQFDATETDRKMNASDAEEPEILQMAYGYKD